jgi:hypothetical protein
MKNLQYNFIAICAWFFFFYNIEKLFGVVNIATFVYVLVFVYAILIVLLRPLQRMPLYGLLLISLLPYIVLRIPSGRPITGTGLPLLVTEICALWITVVLVRNLAGGIENVRKSIASLTLGSLNQETETFDTGQSQIYQEMRRSRRFKRPASLLSISATDHSVQISLDRFIKEAQYEIIDEYVSARIAEFLTTELLDPYIVLRRNDHFIIFLPEANRDDAVAIIKQLSSIAQEQLNLELKVGLATFPDEAVTFETLLQNAEMDMTSSISAQEDKIKPSSPQIKGALS